MTVLADTLVRSLKRQTQAFIAADPSWVTFNRRVGGPVSDGAGGRSYLGNPLGVGAQQVRIVPARTRSSNQVFTTPSGQLVSIHDATLVGPSDLDIQLNDYFTWQGQDFLVTFVYSDRRWQTQAQLDLMGETFRQSI